MDVGKLIYKRRTELKLTLEDVGNAVGVSKSTVKKWEDGYISNMRRDKISELAKILQVNPVSLITGEETSITIPQPLLVPKDELTDKERTLVDMYRQLTQEDKIRVEERIETMLESYPENKESVS